ncbi:MAG: D-alanyl-D-alanine carboxypeptidase family protein [Oscillospiraceae bacterium]
MKKLTALTLSILMIILLPLRTFALEADGQDKKEYSPCYVLMEASTKTVIREQDGSRRVRMGSFNKLMTVLLCAEAMDRGELTFDTVLSTSEHANSMQGAQIWLMPGEKMTLSDLLKGVIIGNANDAACVIAEKIGVTEEKFTELMNNRAAELGMNDTLFTNCSGYYDDDKQYTTAHDAALLLCELSKHDELSEMFTTRLDELKCGEVSLVTTNTMCHRYKGSVGFKCGTGPSSGYFAAEGAQRNGCTFVAAVLDCEEEDTALALSKELLDIAFGGYCVVTPSVPDDMPEEVTVKNGVLTSSRLAVEDIGGIVLPVGRVDKLETEVILPEYVFAPCLKGDKVGELRFYLSGKLVKTCSVTAAEDNDKKSFLYVLWKMIKSTVDF